MTLSNAIRSPRLEPATVLRAVSVKLDAGETKEPPKEFRIFGFGAVSTTKGEFLFDEDAAAQVMAAYQDYGNELPFDYEHGMAAEAGGKPLPACGWFKLELRKDGLWATECRWGAEAAAFLAAGQYRYFSPYMEIDPETGRIMRLINLALTNMPATKSMTPLVAASRRSIRDLRTAAVAASMSFDELARAVSAKYPDVYAWVADVYDDSVVIGVRGRLYQIPYTLEGGRAVLGDAAVEVQRTYTPTTPASEGEPQMKTLLTAIAALTSIPLKDTSSEAEAVAALGTLPAKLSAAEARVTAAEGELLGLTGAKSRSEALGMLEAWKASHTAVAALTAEVGALKGEKAALAAAKVAAEVDAMVEAAVKEGKVSPAQKELLSAKGKADPEFLKAYLSTASKLVTTPGDATRPPKADESTTVVLSAEERAIAKRMKISEADFAAQKKARADREAARLVGEA